MVDRDSKRRGGSVTYVASPKGVKVFVSRSYRFWQYLLIIGLSFLGGIALMVAVLSL